MLDKTMLDSYLRLLTEYGTDGFRNTVTYCPNCREVIPNTNKTHARFNEDTDEDLASMTCLQCKRVFLFRFLNLDYNKVGYDKSGWAFHKESVDAIGTTN